jgi:hypothetical protein
MGCIRRAVAVAAGTVLMLAVAPGVAGQRQAGADRVDLSWDVPHPVYLHYAPLETPVLDTPDAPAPLGRYHFFGYEVDSFGFRAGPVQPLGLHELLAACAGSLPGGRHKIGHAWKRDHDFTHLVDLPPLALAADMQFARLEDHEKIRCAVITGTWTLRKQSTVAEGAGKAGWTAFTLTTTSWFDPAARCARGLRVMLDAEHRNAEGQMVSHRVTGQWRLAARHDSRETDMLNRQIAGAIARGVDALFALQKDGLWPFYQHRRGGTALALSALLASDVSPTDPRIVQAFAAMKDLPVETTYAAAISILAIESKYIDAEERKHYIAGADDLPPPKRNLTPEDRAEMQRLVDWLMDNRNTDNPLWTYTKERGAGGGKWCFSTTHYVMMGLAAAVRCGLKRPPNIPKSVSSYLLKYQQQNGPKHRRVVAAKVNARGVPAFARAAKPTDCRGWEYMTWGTWDEKAWTGTPYGSMTCAGLITQMLCTEWGMALQGPELDAEFGSKAEYGKWNLLMQNSLEGGLTWLEYFYSVTRNPWRSQFHEYFYYLYSMERVAMFTGMRYIGEHPWYHQGSCPLLALQHDNGKWGDGVVETSFALLFLKKGTVPLRSRVVTGEG